MMKKIRHLLLIILISFSFQGIFSQNYITFDPLSIEVSGDSGNEITATVRANCYGSQAGASFIYINPHTIPDNGFQSYSFQDGTSSNILYVGDFTNIVFRFKKTVSSTIATTYKFYADYNDNNGNNHYNFITIKVTYTNNDPDTDGDGVPDSQDNCPNQAGPASNNGCPVATCNINAPSNRTTSNITSTSVKLNWNAVSNANSYQYQYKETSSNSWTSGNTTSLSKQINALNSNTSYNWRVRSRCSNNAYGSWSSTANFTTLSGCQENINITQNVNSGQTDNQKAKISITATNDINNGAIANYDAGTVVYLKSGFIAKSGSNFRAFIEGCSTNTSYYRNSNTSIANSKKNPVINIENSIEIYPNPTVNSLFVKSTEGINKWSLSNFYGKLFYSGNGNIQVIQTQNLLKGVYFLRITLNNGKTITKKIIKTE